MKFFSFFIFIISCLHIPIFGFWKDLQYDENMNVHREKFLEWHAKHRELKYAGDYEYKRVAFTISGTDADEIPKCVDAGKVFEEGPIPYQLMHNGVKVVKDGYCAVWMTDLIFGLKGHHEPQEEKVFYEILKFIPAKSVMIELGSYWAYYSLWFNKKVPDATTYMIEPDPMRMEIGKRNYALNGVQGHFIRGYAGTKDNGDDANFRGAEFVSIDAFLEKNGIDHVAILHSDIQGAEADMLYTCLDSMRKAKIDFFCISTHSPSVHATCIAILKDNGYQILAEHTQEESCSGDGLIAAKRNGILGPTTIPISKYSPQ